ncbi:ubiquitin-conjugating enzyme/RWD-like protein [Microdochium trichocladiopsis]|uniref:Ubiquitin-conjugating enzyme E2 Z n=1 Tax=Microdochium trichocladiopsis TaxID=1682393 RepID=A0A9P8YB73_9PEZI|nr:ubiquitin-conjugating enzyme/RWD-like protein [Microdochium trichocladiopsis]KAH7035288.1 ubiquitin-conjugating enzyme/RWD-like protein [Microdochium trichocladiopsis]
MADHSIFRITKEISDLQKSSDLSLAVAFRDSDVRNVRAIIIGPHDSPYEFGFFEFAIRFPKDYPRKFPAVTSMTTNRGQCRFNPNIYACGKVCLSILGTWRGEPGEEWSAAQGLESILLSIQSLMSSNPYENEPGFENKHGETDKKDQLDYVRKIRHETLRVTVIRRLEQLLDIPEPGGNQPPVFERHAYAIDATYQHPDDVETAWEPFKDLIKHRFLWHYESYLDAVNKARLESPDGTSFARMPFEGAGNSMDGKFNYTALETRLRAIKAALDQEVVQWTEEGKETKNLESTVGINLARQYEQIRDAFKQSGAPRNVEILDGNPFVWILTFFGRPMTNLDGGMFRVRLTFSPRFPEEQPRVRYETKVFHHRVSKDGTPCYFPGSSRRDDVRQHIDAIIEALEEESPPYDPRTLVHLEAHKLFWGDAAEKKLYNRRLRRSVQDSMDEAF